MNASTTFYRNIMTNWRKIQVSDSDGDALNCLIWLEIDLENVACKCYVTDLVNVYSEPLDQKLVKKRFEELNQDLEIDDFKEVLKAIQKNLQGQGESVTDADVKLEAALEKSDNCDNSLLKVNLTWSQDELPFAYQFQLCKDSKKNVKDLVISKLFNCLMKYERVQDVLLSTIRDKDLELEDYQGSGCKLTRKALKTGWFVGLDKVLHDSETGVVPEMCEYFGSTKFLKLLKYSESEQSIEGKNSIIDPPTNCDKEIKVEDDKSIKKRKLEKAEKPNLAKISKNYGFSKNKTKKAKLNL